MLLEYPTYDEIKLRLLQKGTSYLYSKPYPTKHTIFQMRDCDEMVCVDGRVHFFRFEETRYGKAIMNTKICNMQGCNYSEVEVFPPHQNKKVKTNE